MTEAYEDKYITVNGIRLHYLECGDQASRTMVLMHGTMDNAHLWDFIRPGLSSYFRILAPDQRGHGDSGWSRPPAYLCEDYVTDLAEFIEALELKEFILMGHSMGALHSTKYTAMNQTKVKGLIHVDIEPFPPPWNREYLQGLYETYPRSYTSIDEFVAQLQKNSAYASEEILARIAPFGLTRGENGKLTTKFDPKLLKHFDQYDLRRDLAGIGCLMLIVRGEDSAVTRREAAQAMHEAIPGSRFVEIPRASHPVPTDNPTALLQVVMDFLKDSNLIDRS